VSAPALVPPLLVFFTNKKSIPTALCLMFFTLFFTTK
jgi:hypothetical protein